MKAFTYMLIGLLLLVPAFTSAQTGGIRGAVHDEDGSVLPETTVTLTNTETSITRTTVTNGHGEYEFTALAPATYDLGVTHVGFAPYTETGLVVQDITIVVIPILIVLFFYPYSDFSPPRAVLHFLWKITNWIMGRF